MDCSLSTGLTVLVWSASTFFVFVFVFVYMFNRHWHNNSGWIMVPCTSLPVLVEFLVPSRPNKTSFSISWVNGCSPTGLTVLDNWVFDFGWIRWVSLLLPATSESNSFIQLSLKEVFGGGRGDTYTFSYMISSRFHHNNFRDTINWGVYRKG